MDAKQKFFLQQESENTIDKYTKITMGLGAIPIPIVDVAATTFAQVQMIKRLCEINGIEYKDEQGTALISAMTASFAGKFIASFIKGIPVIGWFLGIPAQVAASGVLTYATGRAFMGYIDANKSVKKIRDFDVNDFIKRIKNNVDEGVDYLKANFNKTISNDVIEGLKNFKTEEVVQDVEDKLRDIAKERKAKNNTSKKDYGDEINSLGKEIFYNKEEDFVLWMNRPNKLSEGLTPHQACKKGKHEDVASWLRVLQTISPDYLDIPYNGKESKKK